MNKLSQERRVQVVKTLVEGNSINGTVRREKCISLRPQKMRPSFESEPHSCARKVRFDSAGACMVNRSSDPSDEAKISIYDLESIWGPLPKCP